MESNIFLSYCWKDEELVNKIDNYFKSRQIIFERDKREVESWESIKQFMKRIRKSSCAILVISDNYLKSVNCMYEVLEVMKDEGYKDRILTVVLSDANIYKSLGKAEYIKYWKDEHSKLSKAISEIDDSESTIDLSSELKKTREIMNSIGEFISIIADMNNPNINNICEEISKKLSVKGIDLKTDIEGLEEFLNELDQCRYIETSLYPENPGGEMKYRLKNTNVTRGIHGLNIEFSLSELKSGEMIKLPVIDIIRIEKNTMESFEHKKFYMWCKDRVKEIKYNEYMEMKKLGMKNDLTEEYELLEKINYCHRCTLWCY